jgi:hypothetical protein
MLDKGATKGVPGLQLPPPNPQKLKFEKHKFCRYSDIESFI